MKRAHTHTPAAPGPAASCPAQAAMGGAAHRRRWRCRPAFGFDAQRLWWVLSFDSWRSCVCGTPG